MRSILHYELSRRSRVSAVAAVAAITAVSAVAAVAAAAAIAAVASAEVFAAIVAVAVAAVAVVSVFSETEFIVAKTANTEAGVVAVASVAVVAVLAETVATEVTEAALFRVLLSEPTECAPAAGFLVLVEVEFEAVALVAAPGISAEVVAFEANVEFEFVVCAPFVATPGSLIPGEDGSGEHSSNECLHDCSF